MRANGRSDLLLRFLPKAARPDKYRERFEQKRTDEEKQTHQVIFEIHRPDGSVTTETIGTATQLPEGPDGQPRD